MFTGLLHRLPLLTMFFLPYFFSIQKEGKRLRQEDCDVDLEARQRMVGNKKIEQVLVATLCDWLKTSRNLTDESARPLKPYASGCYVFPVL